MATPYDFMTTRNSQGNSYANGAQSAANPYALPQTGGYKGSQVGGQSATGQGPVTGMANPNTTNQQTGSNTFSLYGGNQPQGEDQSTRATGTGGPGIPGTSRYGAVTPQNSWENWNAARPYGTQYGTYGTSGAYTQPQGQQQQAQAQPNGGNIGGTYQTGGSLYPQQSNPYGMDTSMGGGAQPQFGGIRGPAQTQPPTGGIRGPAQVYQPGSGVPGRSLAGGQQYGGAPSQGGSAQPTPQNSPQQGSSAQPTTRPTTGTGQQQYSQPQGNGQTYANPDPYGQPWVDYMNADGSPHINYSYGQNSGGGAQGPTGPNPGSDTYWQNPNAILGNNRDPRLPANDHGPMQFPNMSTGQQYAQPGGSNGLPFTWDQYSQARNDNPRIAQEWAQLNLPYAQLQQNTNQYNQDFTEAQRRYDQQFLQSQGQQAYDQMMQTRQQHMAEQQYQTGIDQWDRQFAQTQGNDRFNQDMASQDFTRQGIQWNQQFGQQTLNDNRNFALQQTGMNQQYGLDQDRLTLAQQQAGWGQQNAQQGLYLQGQAQSLSELANQQQYGLSQNSQAMQAQQMNQQYGLDIRGMNLQEQNQSQQYGLQQNSQAMQQQQMLHSMGIDTRGMTLQEQAQAATQAFQQQQLGQQATLTREQMASQERMATMAATGRQQAPTAKWVRSW